MVDLSFIPINQYAFFAVWQSPSSPCPAKNYNIDFRLTIRDQCELIADAFTSRKSSAAIGYMIDELISFSTYEVVVWASNDYGDGQQTSMEVTTQSDGK